MKANPGMDLLHYIALVSAFLGAAFVVNNFLTYIFDLPGLLGTLAFLGLTFLQSEVQEYTGVAVVLGLIQSVSFILAVFLPFLILRRQSGSRDEVFLNNCSEIIVSAAFWSVMLIGIVDAAISFVRIEGLLPVIVGEDLALSLGKPVFRGTYVHIPLLLLGTLIACYRRGIDFIWLALLIVFGELLIVITRFIFSYEQAFMGDLVRFWYAGLFLFSSAYTLVHDGHVRVDVIYANFSDKVQAYTNIYGSFLLGIPLCWVVIIRGCWSETSPFNLALLNFEVTQQGFGMYVKYLMSGFLIVFALSMLFQFSSYIIRYMNNLEGIKKDATIG
ncbi:MAG: TRAP transporter small permease subunit [Pseudomonadota bacterium]|nr:TRAP transporter small permease subunit [Pseudomonadota bacterium]